MRLSLVIAMLLLGCLCTKKVLKVDVVGPQFDDTTFGELVENSHLISVERYPEGAPRGGDAPAVPNISSVVPRAVEREIPSPSALLRPVYFRYDCSKVDVDQGEALQSMVLFVAGNPGKDVVLAGYCDERGSAAYNFGLGQKRAAAVKKALGIPGVRIVSYGESRAGNCVEEDCHAENRRVEIIVKDLVKDGGK